MAMILPSGVEAADMVSDARALARKGNRKEAEALLLKRLGEAPDDTDARTLYGTVLSWDGDYIQARSQLEKVLAESPGNGDALQALANVELWTNHPDKAEDLLRLVLQERPNDADVLYADAKALAALKRAREAEVVLRHLLDIDPGSRDALRILDDLGNEKRLWLASVEEYYDHYSDHLGNRFESQLSLKRITGAGSVMGRFSHAGSFGLNSNQIEADFYPGFRKGTYGYLNVGVSPDHRLYAHYRVGSDIYQTLGRGLEGTAGYRRLGFTTPVNIYTAALSKYAGAWLFTGRGYFTRDIAGASQSMQLIARRFLRNETSWAQFRFGRGSTPVEVSHLLDIGVLNSSTYDASLHMRMTGRWEADGEFGWSREDRIGRPRVNHVNANLGASFRF